MYRLHYFLRALITIGVVAAVIAGVGFLIVNNTVESARELYHRQVTAAVQTAVVAALYDATRTAEAPLARYRLLRPASGQSLEALAERYGTTLAVLQMANGLMADVVTGSNQPVVVPQGVQALDPPRRLIPYTARPGDTLAVLAEKNRIPLALLEADNPVLAQRGLLPGDIVFIAVLL
ncbi:MAG: LysM peptidoglycan-binding domain-containing protein [Aggregatilineales bacterium]